MKNGDIVDIFQQWRTKENSEGKAKLIRCINPEFCEDAEQWEVKFLADGFKCERFILKEGQPA